MFPCALLTLQVTGFNLRRWAGEATHTSASGSTTSSAAALWGRATDDSQAYMSGTTGGSAAVGGSGAAGGLAGGPGMRRALETAAKLMDAGLLRMSFLE